MTNEPQTHDAELGQAIKTIPVPPLSPDFLADAKDAALAHRAPSTTVARPRRRWRLIAAAAAAVLAAAAAGGLVGASLTRAPAPASASSSPVLAFTPASNWNSVVAPLPTKLTGNNQVSWASNVPFSGEDLASGWPTETVKTLPPDGVVVFASLAHTVDDPQTYPDRGMPLDLLDGYFLASGYENQPAPNVSIQMIYAHINDQFILVQVWFGRNKPTNTQKQAANEELAHLLIPTH